MQIKRWGSQYFQNTKIEGTKDTTDRTKVKKRSHKGAKGMGKATMEENILK